MPKLLNIIAVKWENGTDRDPPYMLAFKSAWEAADDEERVVGIYKLIGKKKVRKVPRILDVK